MSKGEAAAYCGFSIVVFEREVSVHPLGFGDKRLDRYDRFELDAWIEGRKRPAKGGLKTLADAISEF